MSVACRVNAVQRERDVRISERTLALAEIGEARQKADRLALEVERLEALLSQERIVSEADRRALVGESPLTS